MKNVTITKLSPIQRQVDEYDSLKTMQTYRGQAKILLQLSATVVILASFLSQNLTIIASTILGQLLGFFTLSIFVGRGKRWAIIISQILWTLATLQGISSFLANIQKTRDVNNGDMKITLLAIIIYFFTMRIFVQALRVENRRIKIKRKHQAK